MTLTTSANRSQRRLAVDIWHNVMWSRYKAVVFSDAWKLAQSLEIDIRFYQIAETDSSRALLSSVDHSIHRYPFELLFRSPLNGVPRWRLFLALVTRAATTGADIVCLVDHGHLVYWAQMLVLKLRRKKVAVFCDATRLDNPQSWWKCFLKRLFFRLVDGAFCYGRRAHEYLVDYGMPAKRIYIRRQAAALPANYDAHRIPSLRQRFAPDPLRPIFLFVGRLSPEKRIDTLIHAFARVRSTYPEASLEIVGSGPTREQLRAEAIAFNVAEGVNFIGAAESEALAERYLSATCLVLPSSSEPWGLVVNEALHYGCPVIVSDRCGCVPELVEGAGSGMVFKCGDPHDLATRLEQAASLHADRRRCANACLATIASFTPAVAARQLCEGLLEIQRRKRRGAQLFRSRSFERLA